MIKNIVFDMGNVLIPYEPEKYLTAFVEGKEEQKKPHKEIYLAFLDEFKLVPHECFFVDDMSINIDGAEQVGMTGFVYNGDIDQLRKAILEFELKD